MPILGIWASSFRSAAGPVGAYDALATVTVPSGGAASIEFVGIPTGYKHLQIRGIARVAASTDRNLRLFINGDTTNANYKQHWLYGAGSSAASENNTVAPQIGYLPMSSDTSGMFGVSITDILDYANTSKTKVVRSLFGWEWLLLKVQAVLITGRKVQEAKESERFTMVKKSH